MTKYQREILSYVEKNLILKGKEIFFGYDERSVVIIDNTKILHFIYKDNKISLVDSIVTINTIKNRYKKAV
ncbi:hypothetical protein K5V21_17410 [Clostridium sardiniense]|uniref:Uncharacterized protein n=1 Tax=Clostridium sardiniense TaxID=29369 RepID=A0ABS7L2T0_CLOSR|nr:hypothetical protein [Clostridium sardiniense]MBY0757212.1 hypothetical protein [Clostridium sardiniense]MDQ0462053.1 hypothetical protein [Clostridium sardiniense]